jgi:hypothetical protein
MSEGNDEEARQTGADAQGAHGRRRRRTSGRTYRLTLKFTAAEIAPVREAAAASGLTPTGYAASGAVALARGQVRPLPSSMGEALRELVEARTQLRRFGVLVNQAVAALHSTGTPPASLMRAIELATRAVRRVDDATVALTSGR